MNLKMIFKDFDLESFALAGEHNLENLSVAIEMGLKLGAMINPFKRQLIPLSLYPLD